MDLEKNIQIERRNIMNILTVIMFAIVWRILYYPIYKWLDKLPAKEI